MLALAMLAACQAAGAAPSRSAAVAATGAIAGDPVRGRDVADRNCSLCHAIAPGAASRHPQAPPFSTLGRRYPLEALAEALAEGIVVGHQGMPQIMLEPQPIHDLISYMESIQQPAPPRE
jgi:mono/diheme cytochrome c family protein